VIRKGKNLKHHVTYPPTLTRGKISSQCEGGKVQERLINHNLESGKGVQRHLQTNLKKRKAQIANNASKKTYGGETYGAQREGGSRPWERLGRALNLSRKCIKSSK